MGCPQDPCLPEAPTIKAWSLQRCCWGQSSAAGSGHTRSPSDEEGWLGKDRNTVPASAAPFAGAVLLTSAKTTPAHCAMCLKCHQLWQLPSGSRGHHAAGQERAGGGRGLPGKSQGRRCFSERKTTSALGAVHGPSVHISIAHLPTPLWPWDPHTTAPTPQTSHPLRPTNHTPLCGCRPLCTHAVSRRVLKPWTHKWDTPACVATHRHPRASRARKGLCLPAHPLPPAGRGAHTRVEWRAVPAHTHTNTRTRSPEHCRAQGTRTQLSHPRDTRPLGTQSGTGTHAGTALPPAPSHPQNAPTRGPRRSPTHPPPTRGQCRAPTRGRTCARGGSGSSSSSAGSSPRSSLRRSGAAGPPMSRTYRGRGAQGRAGPRLSPRRESAGPGRIQDAASCPPPPPPPSPGPGSVRPRARPAGPPRTAPHRPRQSGGAQRQREAAERIPGQPGYPSSGSRSLRVSARTRNFDFSISPSRPPSWAPSPSQRF